MAIEGIDNRHELSEFTEKYLSKSHPIDDSKMLYGRSHELELVEDALYSRCTQVFIVGDRGVGKSSIAIVSAKQFQSKDNQFIYVQGGPETTFSSLIANIVYKALKQSRIFDKSKQQKVSLGASFKSFFSGSIEVNETTSLVDVEKLVRDVTDAVRIFEWLQDNHSTQPVILVDEFDRVSGEERSKFADLVKHLGDQRNRVKIIFTGIAGNVNDLIGQHPSATRQIESISVPRLNFDDRWKIITGPLQELNIAIDRELLIRIALISDGFPYYIHLLTEKLLNVLLKDPEIVREVSFDHYALAIERAIETCSTDYSIPYEKAVIRVNDEYEETVWATADTELLVRSTDEMYESYLGITKQTGSNPIDKKVFNKCLANLTKSPYGSILKREQKRKSLFTYQEKMLRGYVRLQAESHGVSLHDTNVNVPKKISANATSTRVGYNASKVPAGVRMKNER